MLPFLPRAFWAIRASLLRRIKSIRNEDPQLPLLFHRALQGFLDVQTFSHDGGVQLAFERQQVHVGLAFGHQISDLLGQDFVRQLLLFLAGAVSVLTEISNNIQQ